MQIISIRNNSVKTGAVLSVVALLLLTGCKTDHARDARFYRDILEQTPAPSPVFVADDLTSPLKLVDALAMVTRNNEQLAMEGEDYVQAILDKKRAAANFLPTVSFSPSYSRSEGFTGPRRQRNDDYRDRMDLPLGLTWNLFNGYRDLAVYYREAATIRQREALLRDLQSSLMLEVVRAFYQTLRAEQSIKVLESSLQVQEERVRDISARRDAGIARPLDVAQTEAVASEARVALISARQSAENARQVLALLLDIPVGQRPLVDDLIDEMPQDIDTSLWQTSALELRQDLLAKAAAVEAAHHQVENAFGQYYPSVTLDLEYLLTINRVESETGWNAVLRAHLPIFSAGRINAEVRIAWSQLRQAELDYRYTSRLIQHQTVISQVDFQASEHRLSELGRKLDAARIAYEQADSSYNVGLATNLERLDAQDRQLLTELEIANERYVLREAYLTLLRSAGMLDGMMLAQRLPASPETQPAPQQSAAPTEVSMHQPQ